jgi:nickel superoxide dismutase
MIMRNFLHKVLNIKEAQAHCDLMCGVYDPAQARIEAQSVYNAIKVYEGASDEITKQRALAIKEERTQLAKEHLWVLWTDYFKLEHVEKFPELHDLFWRATKVAGEVKKTADIAVAQKLIDLIDEIGNIFEQTKEGYSYEAVRKNMEGQRK